MAKRSTVTSSGQRKSEISRSSSVYMPSSGKNNLRKSYACQDHQFIHMKLWLWGIEFLQAMEVGQDCGCCWEKKNTWDSRSCMGKHLLISFKSTGKSKCPFQGSPARTSLRRQPFSHEPCNMKVCKSHLQEILHPETHPLSLIFVFEVWIHPQHVTQRHIKEVATPMAQGKVVTLQEREKLVWRLVTPPAG